MVYGEVFMKLSIVTTLYYSSSYIDEFYKRISKTVQEITNDYEIIFVDDGSPDDSLQKAIELYKKDDKVKVIELSRNFGHHKAIMTGLSHANGNFIFLIDVDLEENPEYLSLFWETFNNDNTIDVVYGVQKSRKGNLPERIFGGLFWKLLNFLSDSSIPQNMMTSRLMTRKYIKSLLDYHEQELFLGGVMENCGFKQIPLYLQKQSTSKTTYTLRKKINLLVNSITSFSTKPLIYIFNLGIIITFLSSIYISKLIYNKLVYGITFEGWTSIVVSIWFFGGLIILLLGIIGIYISKIFIETKNRPYTIIKNKWSNKK